MMLSFLVTTASSNASPDIKVSVIGAHGELSSYWLRHSEVVAQGSEGVPEAIAKRIRREYTVGFCHGWSVEGGGITDAGQVVVYRFDFEA